MLLAGRIKDPTTKGYCQPNFIRKILLPKSKINGILQIVFPFAKGYIMDNKEERIFVFFFKHKFRIFYSK